MPKNFGWNYNGWALWGSRHTRHVQTSNSPSTTLHSIPLFFFFAIPTPPPNPPQLLRLWRTCSVQPQCRNLNLKTYVHITCPMTVVGSTLTMELITKAHQAISNSLWLLVRERNHMFTIRTPVDGAHHLHVGDSKRSCDEGIVPYFASHVPLHPTMLKITRSHNIVFTFRFQRQVH